jgi:GNAT superfamily N-acetyltransferase
LAGPDDVDDIARLVKELAIYEKEPDGVHVTSENYRVDGCSEEPLFYCLMVDFKDNANNTVTTFGMGLFFLGYTLDGGRILYLEDLFVEEKQRGKGAGKAVMKALAQISLNLQCTQFIWTALDWNEPALKFYRSIGAKHQQNMKISRYCGKDLQTFANQKL